MITYHQGFDIYHTAFRIVRMLQRDAYKPMHIDKLRILDFLLLFPEDFKNVTVPISARFLKRLPSNKYNVLPNRKRVFHQLGKYFELSVQCLLSYELIDINEYKNGYIKIVEQELANQIAKITANSLNEVVLAAMQEHFFAMPLSDLKQRTGLIEYRYDIPQS